MSSTVKRMAAMAVVDGDEAGTGLGKRVYWDIVYRNNFKKETKLKTDRAAMDEKDLSQFLQLRSPWTAALSAERYVCSVMHVT